MIVPFHVVTISSTPDTVVLKEVSASVHASTPLMCIDLGDAPHYLPEEWGTSHERIEVFQSLEIDAAVQWVTI